MDIKHVSGEFKVDDISLENASNRIRAYISSAQDSIDKDVKELVLEVVKDLFINEGLKISLPQIYSYDLTSDPLEVFLYVDYDSYGVDPINFSFSLRDLLIEGAGDDELLFGSGIVANELRKLADEIDRLNGNNNNHE